MAPRNRQEEYAQQRRDEMRDTQETLTNLISQRNQADIDHHANDRANPQTRIMRSAIDHIQGQGNPAAAAGSANQGMQQQQGQAGTAVVTVADRGTQTEPRTPQRSADGSNPGRNMEASSPVHNPYSHTISPSVSILTFLCFRQPHPRARLVLPQHQCRSGSRTLRRCNDCSRTNADSDKRHRTKQYRRAEFQTT